MNISFTDKKNLTICNIKLLSINNQNLFGFETVTDIMLTSCVIATTLYIFNSIVLNKNISDFTNSKTLNSLLLLSAEANLDMPVRCGCHI